MCLVFGHDDNSCPLKPKVVEEDTSKVDEDGFQKAKTSKYGKNSGFQVGKQKQKFEYRPVQKENRKLGGTHQHAVISNRFEILKSDPGPSGTKTSEDDDIVEESGVGELEMDTFTKKDGLNRRDDSEGASTPGKNGLND
ncbi:hypothetical protein QVD17_12006 [Tagetes erecta]|uniref:Zinc knuckle CX2CX4HX4C n=1 Tax=Tagetes erecta TaxID=13708 RepID=A0AAD8P2K2_TARER|nr:hypothetical protein QVD17_12006 [Tagetes erecta]